MGEQIASGENRPWAGPVGSSLPDDREDRLLPWPSVRQIAGISRTTAWRLQQMGDFPRPVPISANRVGWWESDLTAWKAKRRFACRERPRPYGQTTMAREAPTIPPPSTKTAPETARLDVSPTDAKPMPQAPPPPRRPRRRAVSPDQIDFGF